MTISQKGFADALNNEGPGDGLSGWAQYRHREKVGDGRISKVTMGAQVGGRGATGQGDRQPLGAGKASSRNTARPGHGGLPASVTGRYKYGLTSVTKFVK